MNEIHVFVITERYQLRKSTILEFYLYNLLRDSWRSLDYQTTPLKI